MSIIYFENKDYTIHGEMEGKIYVCEKCTADAEGNKPKLPDVPQKGDLDINELRKSEFFFA